ncbi:MAG: hypothetical protein CSA62_00810 [Planctomycetota bacterium]|nr:MAG: hypothetical protein CSA62_00810 [Planctomycetota bacterium]
MRFTLPAVLLLAMSAHSQILPGQYLHSVTQQKVGELWVVDSFTQKAKQLKLSTPVDTNCIMMQSPVTGFVGTNTAPAQIYGVTIVGSNAIMKPVFKTPSVLTNQTNISQIGKLGSMLYFVTNDSATTKDGTIWSLPATGKADPAMVYDLSTLSGFPTGGLANALCCDGKRKVYVAVWPGGVVFEYDIPTKKARLLATMPATKAPPTSGFYPVNMHYRKGKLEVYGLYGDVVVLDPVTAKVDAHYWAKAPTATGYSAMINSGVWNPDQGHYNFGTRDGALEALLPIGSGQLAHRIVEGVGSNVTASGNSVNGTYYQAVGGNSTYLPYGAGCAGTGGFTPTSTGLGLPSGNNKAWAFGIHTLPKGTNLAVLVIGGNQGKYSLAGLGLPSCSLYTLPLLVMPATTNLAVANGFGWAKLPINTPANITVATQWVIWNTLGNKFDAASDARLLKL